jgi:uncharacterized membrane protein (UPF0127 family)
MTSLVAKRLLLLASLLLVGSVQAAEPSAGTAKIATGSDVRGPDAWFPLTVGEKTLRVQLVVTLDEQQRGLMGRRDLGVNDGMIFVYPAPQEMSFWMRSTPTPLDIGFFKEDGTLGEVYPMYPFDETPVKSVGSDYTLALETPQGWFAKNGLKPGVKLKLADVAAALRARGFKPSRYSAEPR